MINLAKKGDRINLTKASEDSGVALKNGYVGSGWDIKRYDGSGYDIDLILFMLNKSGNCISEDYFIAGAEKDGGEAYRKADGSFYDHDPEEAVHHTGDNNTGAGDGDDEAVTIDFTKLNPEVDKIVCCVTMYEAHARHQTFGDVDNAYFRFVNPDTNQEWRYDLSEDYSSYTSVVGVELYKHQKPDGTTEWKMKATGEGYDKELDGLLDEYGLGYKRE